MKKAYAFPNTRGSYDAERVRGCVRKGCLFATLVVSWGYLPSGFPNSLEAALSRFGRIRRSGMPKRAVVRRLANRPRLVC